MSTYMKSAIESTTDHVRRRAEMDALFTSHAAEVYAFALRRTSRSAAQDVVSETFLVAWRRFDSVPDAPRPWLLGVARRVLANQRRSDGRQIALRTRVGSSDPNTSEQDAAELAEPEALQGDSAVLAALAALTPSERDAITLIAWDGLGAEEAAIVLGCSRAAFYVRVHRARRRLAAALGTAIDSFNEQEADPS
ncbi:MAG: RNA polymerase sigma factor [Ilumatobacteraceae bacterium]